MPRISPPGFSRALGQRRFTRRQAVAMGGAALAAPALLRTGAMAQEAAGGSLFPDNRVLLYYGFPGNPNMGILGEYEPQQVMELLQEEAAAYQAADPSRTVKIGFEMIASVAQGDAGQEGKYIADASRAQLDEYTQFTADNDMLLFFDVQMGFRTPYEDYSGLEEWLLNPHVHLGIDPEFHMREGELPGQHIGQVTAADVTEAQHWLADLAAKNNLPPKTLIVHQFHHTMIEEKDQIAPVPGVDLVIDMDGWGPPEMKRETYEVVIKQEPIEYHGVKLFYRQDDPLMTPEEIVALDPAPDLVIYQ